HRHRPSFPTRRSSDLALRGSGLTVPLGNTPLQYVLAVGTETPMASAISFRPNPRFLNLLASSTFRASLRTVTPLLHYHFPKFPSLRASNKFAALCNSPSYSISSSPRASTTVPSSSVKR